MDYEMADTLVQMGVNLAALIAKGTATAVYSRVESVWNEKSADAIRATYDEVVNRCFRRGKRLSGLLKHIRKSLRKLRLVMMISSTCMALLR